MPVQVRPRAPSRSAEKSEDFSADFSILGAFSFNLNYAKALIRKIIICIMFEEMINRIYGMMESGAVLGMVILIFVLDIISLLAVAIAAFTDSDKKMF